MAPRTRSWEELLGERLPDTRPPVESGEAWLKRQKPEIQEQVLGRDGAAAFRAGEVSLQDYVAVREHPVWGKTRTAKSTKAALASADIRKPAIVREIEDRLGVRPKPKLRFATPAEAEAWAKQNIRGLKDADFSGMDAEVADAVANTVKVISDRFEVDVPAIMPQSWTGWADAPSGAPFSAGKAGIRYNPKYTAGIHKEAFLAGWAYSPHASDAAKTLAAVVAHEMGHLLQRTGRTSAGTLLLPATPEVIVRVAAERLRANAGEAAIRKELGDYAWDGGWQETWAQAFSACWSNPSSLSVRTRSMVIEVLKDLGRY